VVTGLGAVTPEGVGLDAYWAGVRGGVVAIREVEHLPMDGYRTQLGGEVTDDFTPTREYLQPDGFHDRAIDFTMRAAEEAMSSSGTAAEQVPPERWGVVIGTCNAGLLAGEEWYAKRKRGENPDPRLVLLVEPQAFSEALASAFQL
jgi:3-oxoacyl-[acyl-carrier-protein] synthase II